MGEMEGVGPAIIQTERGTEENRARVYTPVQAPRRKLSLAGRSNHRVTALLGTWASIWGGGGEGGGGRRRRKRWWWWSRRKRRRLCCEEEVDATQLHADVKTSTGGKAEEELAATR